MSTVRTTRGTTGSDRQSGILVADDDASVRESVSKVLRDAGYAPVTAADSQEAMERFQNERIDLLVLDLGMPIKSGWEVFERITRDNPFLPVIVITGQTNQQFTAMAAGVGALMEKPLDVERLLETVQELLAEPKEARLRRLSGREDSFHFVPSASALFMKALKERHSRPFPAHRSNGLPPS